MNNKMNPLSEFFKGKDGGVLSEQEAQTCKIGRFCKDVYEAKAISENGRHITLGKMGAKLENVDFIGGMWRIQRKFPYKITHVRDKDMVLLKKLDYVENTFFEYWTAKMVGYNCYGACISKDKGFDFIVAKYETDDKTYWGYGRTIEEARAFLGLKVYDEYKSIINAIACKNKIHKK